MPRNLLAIEQLIDLLAAAPKRITAAAADLPPTLLRTPPDPDEWSANDILAHLRACGDMWGGYIMRILAEDHPTIRAINPRSWINQTDYPNLEFHPSLDAYTKQRADLLAVLQPLPREDWSRPAMVTGAGKPLELTVHAYANRLAIHERAHVNQIERTLISLRPDQP